MFFQKDFILNDFSFSFFFWGGEGGEKGTTLPPPTSIGPPLVRILPGFIVL